MRVQACVATHRRRPPRAEPHVAGGVEVARVRAAAKQQEREAARVTARYSALQPVWAVSFSAVRPPGSASVRPSVSRLISAYPSPKVVPCELATEKLIAA